MPNMKKYGKLLLSAYIMKKIKPGGSQQSKGAIGKYGKLLLGAYLIERLKSEKSESEEEIVPEIELEEVEISETGGGSSLLKITKFAMGVLVGVSAIYALKKYSVKKSGYKIEVQ